MDGAHSGLVFIALDFGSRRSGFEPWAGHCVVFLGKTLNNYSHSLDKIANANSCVLALGT